MPRHSVAPYPWCPDKHARSPLNLISCNTLQKNYRVEVQTNIARDPLLITCSTLISSTSNLGPGSDPELQCTAAINAALYIHKFSYNCASYGAMVRWWISPGCIASSGTRGHSTWWHFRVASRRQCECHSLPVCTGGRPSATVCPAQCTTVTIASWCQH